MKTSSKRNRQGCVDCFIGALGSRVGWGRSCQCAHAHSVGNTIENGELCRAVQKTSRTRPLGTTAGVPEDSPGDCRTGRLLTGANSESFPGDNLLLRPRRRQRRERSTNPAPSPCSLSSLLLSAPQERPRASGDVAAKRVGFVPVRLPAPTVNTSVQRQEATAAGFTMVLLAARSRRCLHSCCMGTLCLQLLLWILCAVNGEEQPFSVEVRAGTVVCWHGSISSARNGLSFPLVCIMFGLLSECCVCGTLLSMLESLLMFLLTTGSLWDAQLVCTSSLFFTFEYSLKESFDHLDGICITA